MHNDNILKVKKNMIHIKYKVNYKIYDKRRKKSSIYSAIKSIKPSLNILYKGKTSNCNWYVVKEYYIMLTEK